MADIAQRATGREPGGFVNLDLPFDETDPAVLDAYLDRIDDELDGLFLRAVAGELERLRLEKLDPPDDAAA